MTTNTIDPTLSARLQDFITALDHDNDALWVEGEVKLSVLAPTFGPLSRAQVRASGAIRRVAETETVTAVAVAPGSVEEAERDVIETELAMRLAIAKTIETRQRVRRSREALAVAVKNWSAAFPVVDFATNHKNEMARQAAHRAAGNVAQPTPINGSPLDQFAAYTKPGSGGRANDPSSFRRGGSVRRLPSQR